MLTLKNYDRWHNTNAGALMKISKLNFDIFN